MDRIRGKRVLDVGSQDINGSYRKMFEDIGCQYIGVDIVAGSNVDVVTIPECFPFEDASFDVVVSGQTLEHAKRPWILAKEMGRVLITGGLSCWIAPWEFQVHKDAQFCPFDCWRILDDGMRVLMIDAGLEILNCQMHGGDTYGIGQKICSLLPK